MTPRHLLSAIKGDEEMTTLITATIAGGGKLPNIHSAMLAKHKKGKRSKNSVGSKSHKIKKSKGKKSARRPSQTAPQLLVQ